MSHYGPEFVKKAQELRKAAPPDYAAVEKTAQDLVGSAIQFKIGEIFHKAAAQVKTAGPTPGVGQQLLDQTQRLVRALTRSVDKELVGVERLRKELEASGRLRPTSKTPGASPTPKTPAELMAAHERATKRYGDALHGRLPSGHSPVSKVRGTPAYPEGLSVPKFTGRPTLPESGYPSKLKGGKFLRDIGSKVMGLPPWAQLLLGAAGAAGGTVGVHALLKKKDKKQEKVAGIWETLTGQRTSKLTPVRTGKVDPAWKPYPASAAGLPMPATPPAQPKVQQAGMLPSVPKPDSGKLRSIATGGVDSRMRRAGL